MDVADLRKEYTKAGLSRKSLHADPVEQFRLWFDQALSAGIAEPNAMALATVDSEGRPTQRTVLLKAYDARGFVFFTNYHSRKSRHIEGNAAVSLIFPWVDLERQVIIGGKAEKISSMESLRYYTNRPRGSQIGAWVSRQSEVITSRKMLEMKWEEMKRKFAAGQIPLPDFWGGYRVVPTEIEFWQGRPNRLHDRFLYTRADEGDWSVQRLSP
jgi:pyridoxamine 5'-phosphate oxidase